MPRDLHSPIAFGPWGAAQSAVAAVANRDLRGAGPHELETGLAYSGFMLSNGKGLIHLWGESGTVDRLFPILEKEAEVALNSWCERMREHGVDLHPEITSRTIESPEPLLRRDRA